MVTLKLLFIDQNIGILINNELFLFSQTNLYVFVYNIDIYIYIRIICSYLYNLFRPNVNYGHLKNHQRRIIKSQLKVKKH